MYSKVNLGDGTLENYLPSWVSNHLGGKFYMTDNINQSPSSPLEGSPHGNSSVHMKPPEIDTSNLIKEVNIMTQGDLDKLKEKYSFPPGIQIRIPGESETILSTRPSEVAFYEAAFPTGLRFPIHPIIRRILNHYKICPTQLSSNAWLCIVCSLVIWLYYKHHMSCDEFRGSPSNVKGWKKRFFFASRDEWEFFPSMPSSVGIPRVPRSWGVPGSKLPALIEIEAKRTAEVLRKIKTGPILRCRRSWLPRPSRPMFSRISMSMLTKKAREKKATTKDASSVATSKPPSKGIIIQEKLPRDDAHDPAPTKEGEVDDSKGKEAMPPPPPKRTKSNNGASNAARRSLALGGPSTSPSDSLREGRSVHHELIGHQVLPCPGPESQLTDLDEHTMKTEVELKDKSKAMAQLDAKMIEFTGKLARAKELAIDEFKSSNDFKDAITDSAATYFGKGFEFCKRQLLHHHPNLRRRLGRHGDGY
ncbi:hypothetical protein Acr_18g0009000 [Actinidia rufa]|uniref:Uncharacterized protein n=1 Tax=Actinidia rufa TaxID=165716 RepID=A0A7J0G7F5_9ERIC|nr:hypothetical protein Acr_18g0009000 [Actinidia rufa]